MFRWFNIKMILLYPSNSPMRLWAKIVKTNKTKLRNVREPR